jgi:geranylgeranyl diphosphate synthase, type II
MGSLPEPSPESFLFSTECRGNVLKLHTRTTAKLGSLNHAPPISGIDENNLLKTYVALRGFLDRIIFASPITRSPDEMTRSPYQLYSSFMLKEILQQGQQTIDQALDKLLPPATQRPESIHKAMRHSVFAGGKRLRPILCMEAARMIAGQRPAGVEELGCALEMLHTYSLIHDDLPALDNDDLRRGKPTCHVVYGEAVAILAGDALQTQAYQVLARLKCPAEARVRIIEEIARATGTVDGMIGGQVKDLEAEHHAPDAATLEYIHRSKTGALITASLVSGAIYANASIPEVQRLRDFGRSIGLAFQIVDDVLDVTQSSEQLGKTAGKDTASEKATYPALFGVEESLRRADALVLSACNALESFLNRADTLKELAHFLVQRKK